MRCHAYLPNAPHGTFVAIATQPIYIRVHSMLQPLRESEAGEDPALMRAQEQPYHQLEAMQSADILLQYKSFHLLARKATSANPKGRRAFFSPAVMDVCGWSRMRILVPIAIAYTGTRCALFKMIRFAFGLIFRSFIIGHIIEIC